MKVVSNTSPLILLAKIEQTHLLTELYAQILIPKAVLEEIYKKDSKEQENIKSFIKGPACTVIEPDKTFLDLVTSRLGMGERAAIALALQETPDLTVLDDREGRKIAKKHNLKITGTIGILIEAHTKGIIPSLKSEVDNLKDAGIWMSDAFYNKIIKPDN